MAKVTSKLQVTLPKNLAIRYGIEPGSDIEWQAAGDVIRVLPASTRRTTMATADKLALFDAATARQKERQRGARATKSPSSNKRRRVGDRGWTREELYDRGTSR
jgi:bifunctional DNA-binding transcriptional regulator/antitoxin component of YhaV-PrlF toxin-antitoxin module